MSTSQTIRVRPVLFCAAVFWTPDFWSKSTHAWDWVQAETPLDEKPWAELEISVDVTLREVLEAACDAWGIEAGPDLVKHGGTRASQFVRIAFVRPERDVDGVHAQEAYRWPSVQPLARANGTVESVPALDLPYRDLLASSQLNLIAGDVTRPYVHPVIPQGDAGTVIEIAKLTAEAVRAAYGAVDASVGYAEHTIRLIRSSVPEVHRTADAVVDEGIRVGFIITLVHWLRGRVRRRP
jgi:hypothetical protein